MNTQQGSLVHLPFQSPSYKTNKIIIDDINKYNEDTLNVIKETVKDIKIELEKLIAKNDKFKDLTPEKLTAEQKEIFIKEFQN